MKTITKKEITVNAYLWIVAILFFFAFFYSVFTNESKDIIFASILIGLILAFFASRTPVVKIESSSIEIKE